ncbi:uncharacterized protein LOC122038666 [Zingiber officinale]|uniref:Uncharacterized protein n=1 Tax=Zingiber officinale TaxID=94328 RepID=A0A8J5I9P3_ZINOF|nr:uncharacterized protein LOC122038666 [Zingiber officinale]KAG6538899.1 hypothetical protein ZIOFF_004051 [Zingiber officinale]
MASGLFLNSIRPAVACASAVDGRGGRRGVPTSRASGNSWWAPLFGWSPEADYIDAPVAGAAAAKKGAAAEGDEREKKRQQAVSVRKFTVFTEEKAKQLRIRMMETEAFHDAMYHSAIASRLASDVPRRGSA